MAQSAITKRLERLEQSAGRKKANRVRVYHADGSTKEMDILSLACAVLMKPEPALIRYELLGEDRSGKLLQVIDDLLQ